MAGEIELLPFRVLQYGVGHDVNGLAGRGFGDHPGYIVGNWYIPLGVQANVAGSNGGIGSVRLYPGYLRQKCTLNALGVRIVTGSAGNIQAAIYAHNPATGRPTGLPLASTASMSTASTASVNASISMQLDAGLYWFATNTDNIGSTAIGGSTTYPFGSQIIGSATQASAMGAGAGTFVGVSTPLTFGTWSDLTAATFTEAVGVNTFPAVQFKIGSVP